MYDCVLTYVVHIFYYLLQKLYFNARIRKIMNFVNKHGFVIAVSGGNV